jgi:hypothetical protein
MGEGRGGKGESEEEGRQVEALQKGAKQRPGERICPHPEGGCGRPQSGYKLRKLSPNLKT